MTRQQAYARLGLIMLLYVALAVLYSLALPLHKAADEIAHFRYARFIAQHGRLPLTAAEREQADYKSNQPPLYHALVAALTGWSDSPDPPHLKFVWESPRADLAEILLDTTRLANTVDEKWPYRGPVLMWHLGRAVTILCGLGVIVVTFLTALELFPGHYRPAIISATIIAFVPAFIFYSAALSYEPLFALIIGLYFLFLIRIVKGDTRPRNVVALGLFLGLSVMVKYAAVILPLEVVVVFAALAWNRRGNTLKISPPGPPKGGEKKQSSFAGETIYGQQDNQRDESGDESTPSQPPPARGRGENLPPSGGDRGGANLVASQPSALASPIQGEEKQIPPSGGLGGLTFTNQIPSRPQSECWLWLRRLTIVAAAAIVASAWWFLFLMLNFNEVDQLGPVMGLLKPILAGGGDTTQNYIAYQLTEGEIGAVQSFQMTSEPFWAWALQTFQTFWVEKIGSYPLGLVGPILIGLACLAAAWGLVMRWRQQPPQRFLAMLLLFHLAIFLVLPLVRFLIQGLLNQTAQGRHVLFPAATVLPLLLVYGWQGWLSKKRQTQLAMAVVTLLACWSIAQLFWINLYYAHLYLPIRTTAEAVPPLARSLEKDFGDHLRLIGTQTAIEPGQSRLTVTLYWQIDGLVDEDIERVLRLVRDDETVLEWATQPTNGRYPTRIWEPNETIIDKITLPLVDIPPGDIRLDLQLRGFDGPLPVDGADTLSLATITIPSTADIPPDRVLSVAADGREIVSGVTLWQPQPYRQLHLPEYIPRMTIPLVWQGQPAANEQVKWLLVSSDNAVYPAENASPHAALFRVGPDWPSGDYRLRAELWQGDSVIASRETPPIVTIFNERPRSVTPPAPAYPLQANFGNQLELWGYDLPVRTLTPGQGIPVTLYWQGLRPTAKNYTVFAKLFDDRQQLQAGVERLPADGYNTFYWAAGEVVTDSFELPVDAETPPGIYRLNVGLYEQVDQTALSLPLVINGQPSDVTSVTFGPVKIGGPPPDLVVDQVAPDVPVAGNFGDGIALHGYDAPLYENQALRLKLYWQSLAPVPTDYTVFVHVRDSSGTMIAQMDRPPTNNRYPTSLWSAGEIIADEIFVPLPEAQDPADVIISVGLYDFATGARLLRSDTDEDSLKLLSPVNE